MRPRFDGPGRSMLRPACLDRWALWSAPSIWGLIQTLLIGGLFYVAALAVVDRVRIHAEEAPEPGATRVVLAQ